MESTYSKHQNNEKKHDKGPYDVNDTAGGAFADTDEARIVIPRIQEWLYCFCKGDFTTK